MSLLSAYRTQSRSLDDKLDPHIMGSSSLAMVEFAMVEVAMVEESAPSVSNAMVGPKRAAPRTVARV